MKVTELVAALQAYLAVHGDRDVFVVYERQGELHTTDDVGVGFYGCDGFYIDVEVPE